MWELHWYGLCNGSLFVVLGIGVTEKIVFHSPSFSRPC